jgi:dolichyl-phosphate beta-glucosyltransferase
MMRSTKPSVTIVVPTYREQTFGESLDYLLDHLDHAPERSVEILVVDDSNPEEHAQLVSAVSARHGRMGPNRRIEVLSGPRLGKGAAVRAGAKAAKGDIIFLIDADIPVLPSFIDLFLEKIESGVDIVIAVRDADRYAGDPVRRVLARGLLALQTVAVFHRRLFADTQCGFKAFRGDVLRELTSLQFTDGGMYDLEYLYAALQRGFRIEQVPVQLRGEVRQSRINLLRCVFVDPLEILYFKGRGVFGYYRRGS